MILYIHLNVLCWNSCKHIIWFLGERDTCKMTNGSIWTIDRHWYCVVFSLYIYIKNDRLYVYIEMCFISEQGFKPELEINKHFEKLTVQWRIRNLFENLLKYFFCGKHNGWHKWAKLSWIMTQLCSRFGESYLKCGCIIFVFFSTLWPGLNSYQKYCSILNCFNTLHIANLYCMYLKLKPFSNYRFISNIKCIL